MRTFDAAVWATLVAALGMPVISLAQEASTDNSAEHTPQTVTVEWDKVLRTSRTSATLQAVVTPLMANGSPVHDQVWGALKDLHASYVRYVPWLPYPKLAVAELQPPENGKTSWDFSLIDPFTIDFFNANPQVPVIINFSTIPQWMFLTGQPVPYPSDPYHPVWNYTQGTELRDPSLKELADYFGRLVSWYTKGGFTDELGQLHASGHYYTFDHWEVLNEIDLEHSMTPEQYTARYDAIVAAVRGIQPNMKFVGLALAGRDEEYFEYFLNPAHHKSGIPLDMISYHFYAQPASDEPQENWQYTVFDQSARFIQTVAYIDAIRRHLSPNTGTAIDEIGVIAPVDFDQNKPGYVFKPLPGFYWNLCAAQFAYLYAELARLGIDAVGESALMQLPGFFPSVSMMDWDTGKPNARYWSLKLLRENFGPGDKLIATSGSEAVFARGFITTEGKKKVLLVNMRNKPVETTITGVKGARVDYVDQATAYGPPATDIMPSDTVRLQGFAVAIVTLRQ